MQGIIANNLPVLPAAVYQHQGEQQDIATFTTNDEFDLFLQHVTRAKTPELVSTLFFDDFQKDLPQALALCQIALHPAGRVYLEHKGLQEKSDNCSRLLLDKLKPDVRREMLEHPVLLATGHLALTLPTDSSRPDFALPLPPVCFEERQGALTPAEVDSMWKVLQHRSRPASDKREADAFHHMASIYQQAEQPDIAIWIEQQANSFTTQNQTNSLAKLTGLAVEHIASYLPGDSPVQTRNNLIALAVNKHLKAVIQPDLDAAKISVRLQQLQKTTDKSRPTLVSFTAAFNDIKNLREGKRAPLLGDLAQLTGRLPVNQRQTAFDIVLNEILKLPEMHQARPLAQLAHTINRLPARHEVAFSLILKMTLALRPEYQKFPLASLASSINTLPDDRKKAGFDHILTITLALPPEHRANPLLQLAQLIEEPWLSDGQKRTAFDVILNTALALPPQEYLAKLLANLLRLTQESWLSDKQKRTEFDAILEATLERLPQGQQAELLDRLAQLIKEPWLPDAQKRTAFNTILNAALVLPPQEHQAALLARLVKSIYLLSPVQRQATLCTILKMLPLPSHHEYQADLLTAMINSIIWLGAAQRQVILHAILEAAQMLLEATKMLPQANQGALLSKIWSILGHLSSIFRVPLVR